MLSIINIVTLRHLSPSLFDCVCFTYIDARWAHTTKVYVMYIYHTCVHMLCSHGTNASIYAMPILPICTCVLYLYHTHTYRDTLDTHMCILYTYQTLHTCKCCAHMGVHTNVGHTLSCLYIQRNSTVSMYTTRTHCIHAHI